MAKPLNILMVVIDSARVDRFGCYGYTRPTTPAIDALALQSRVYDRMITTAPWTLPSHASLLTGLYSREHMADYPSLKMRSGPLTLDAHLRRFGYHTLFVSNNPMVTKRTGIIDGASALLLRRDFNPDFRRPWRRRLKLVLGHADRGSGATTDIVSRVLGERSGPFFIFINFMECHWRYTAPRAYERRFVRRKYSTVDSAVFRMRTRRRYSWENARCDDPDEIQLLSDLYDASLACVDDRIGSLLAALRQSGHADDTIVLLTGDHGENLGEHGLTGHGMSLNHTLLHVPFIARIPEQSPARIGGLVQFTDVFAGLCRTAGIEVPDSLRGRRHSVDPFAMNPTEQGRDFAFAEWRHSGTRLQSRLQRTRFTSPPSMDAVMDGRYKLIVAQDGKRELFDLKTDPGETQNRHGELAQEEHLLSYTLEAWREAFQPVGTLTPYTPDEERAVNARLRELGYI